MGCSCSMTLKRWHGSLQKYDFRFLSQQFYRLLHTKTFLDGNYLSWTLGTTRGPTFLPVWSLVWVGFVQPGHHFLTLPTGTVQETARSNSFTGRFERIQPKWIQVSGNLQLICLLLQISVFPRNMGSCILSGLCIAFSMNTQMMS